MVNFRNDRYPDFGQILSRLLEKFLQPTRKWEKLKKKKWRRRMESMSLNLTLKMKKKMTKSKVKFETNQI